jgi:hypothetical protein
MTTHRSILITLALTLTLACTTEPEADDEAGTTTSPSTTDADADVTTSDDESSTTSTSTTSTSTTDTTSEDSSSFIPNDDMPGELCMCDTFAQDCPEGEKCVPFSFEGGVWDCVKCVPVLGDQAVGESCFYDGIIAGTDNCDAASWCWNVDENGEGVCHLFCTGAADMPECPPMSQCTISGSGVINICISTCDPVVQNCPDGTACYWTSFDFNCVVTTIDIPTGDPCGFVNDCALGNMCVDEAALPECEGASCCANFCDLDIGDSQCGGTPGTACVAFFEANRAPPEYEHVGLCILPP